MIPYRSLGSLFLLSRKSAWNFHEGCVFLCVKQCRYYLNRLRSSRATAYPGVGGGFDATTQEGSKSCRASPTCVLCSERDCAAYLESAWGLYAMTVTS